MIDVGGLVFVLAALRSSGSGWITQFRAVTTVLSKPVFMISRAGDMISDFGSVLFPRWYRHYFVVERIASRCGVALFIAVIGMALTKAFISNL